VSAWTNGWKIRLSLSAGDPVPVSVTSKRSSAPAADGGVAAHPDDDLAGLGELQGVLHEVRQDLAHRPGRR
jgi:hypothetical protein